MPGNPNYVARGWASFSETCVPASARADQKEALRLAFYAGALILFETLLDTSDPTAAEPTETDMGKAAAIDAELEAFMESAQHARARPN